MKRPIIAVTGDYNPETNLYFLKREYMEAIWTNGGIPMIIEPKIEIPQEWTGDREELIERVEIEEEMLEAIDGVLFTGGNDVDPNFYGDDVHKTCGSIIPFRDAWELKLIRELDKRDIPCLGLCRGIQSMAAGLGVKLVQDLYTEGDMANNQHGQKAPTWYPTHKIYTVEGSKMREILGESCWVNSFHHQCLAKDQDYPFDITACSGDGIIEGFEKKDRFFCMGVQWHPERMMHDPVQRNLFKVFIDHAAAHSHLND